MSYLVINASGEAAEIIAGGLLLLRGIEMGRQAGRLSFISLRPSSISLFLNLVLHPESYVCGLFFDTFTCQLFRIRPSVRGERTTSGGRGTNERSQPVFLYIYSPPPSSHRCTKNQEAPAQRLLNASEASSLSKEHTRGFNNKWRLGTRQSIHSF